MKRLIIFAAVSICIIICIPACAFQNKGSQPFEQKTGRPDGLSHAPDSQAVKSPSLSGNRPLNEENLKQKRVEVIDLYRVEIARRVSGNWEYSEQLAGENKNIKVRMVFKVMPDGDIQDIYFIERSGNKYLDDSAYKAVIKTNPAPPHPKGMAEPFVGIGLIFTPDGLR